MRKLVSGLLLAGLFVMALFSPGAAFAYEEPQPEGQAVKSYIGLAYFQVWKHSDGRWQDTDLKGDPDRPGQVKSWDFKVPGSLENLTDKWNLTGVRVRFLPADQWNVILYQDYKGYKGLSFSKFKKKILKYSAARCEEGRVWTEEHFPGEWTYTLHYEGIRLAAEPGINNEGLAKQNTMDLKQKDNRTFVQSLDIPLSLPAGVDFAQMAEGYIYWVPYIVEVYGTPKGKPKAPNFSVELDPGCPTEPAQVADAGPGAWRFAQHRQYYAVPGKTYTATAKFRVGSPVPGQVPPPFDVIVAGMHKVGSNWYPASLEYAGGNGDVKRQQGFEPEIPIIPADVTVHFVTFNAENSEVEARFSWTAQENTKALGAVINLDYPEDDPLPFTFTFYAEGETGTDYGDNAAVVPVTVLAPDLYVRSLDPGTDGVEPGKRYDGRATFGLKPDFPAPVKAKLELTHNGFGVPGVNSEIVTFNPGEEKSFDFTFTGGNTDSILVAKIRPVEVNADVDWSNNTRKVQVPLKKTCTDISVSLSRKPGGAVVQRGRVVIIGKVHRDNRGPQGPVSVRAELTGSGVNYTRTISLSRGETREIRATIESIGPGWHSYTLRATPLEVEDCNPGNNRASLDFNVVAIPTLPPPDPHVSVELIS